MCLWPLVVARAAVHGFHCSAPDMVINCQDLVKRLFVLHHHRGKAARERSVLLPGHGSLDDPAELAEIIAHIYVLALGKQAIDPEAVARIPTAPASKSPTSID